MLSSYENITYTAHFAPVTWYDQTIVSPEATGGLWWSFSTGGSPPHGPDVIEYCGYMFGRSDDPSMHNWTDDGNPVIQQLRDGVRREGYASDSLRTLAPELGLTLIQ